MLKFIKIILEAIPYFNSWYKKNNLHLLEEMLATDYHSYTVLVLDYYHNVRLENIF